MILIIIGSYLKHMDGVISSSCTALPLGHSLFSSEEGWKRQKENKNFHMLTFTQWFFFLIALCLFLFFLFLICPRLMRLKVELKVFYWSHALCWTKPSWLLWPCVLALSYLTTCITAFIIHVKHATRRLDLGSHGNTPMGQASSRCPLQRIRTN